MDVAKGSSAEAVLFAICDDVANRFVIVAIEMRTTPRPNAIRD